MVPRQLFLLLRRLLLVGHQRRVLAPVTSVALAVSVAGMRAMPVVTMLVLLIGSTATVTIGRLHLAVVGHCLLLLILLIGALRLLSLCVSLLTR